MTPGRPTMSLTWEFTLNPEGHWSTHFESEGTVFGIGSDGDVELDGGVIRLTKQSNIVTVDGQIEVIPTNGVHFDNVSLQGFLTQDVPARLRFKGKGLGRGVGSTGKGAGGIGKGGGAGGKGPSGSVEDGNDMVEATDATAVAGVMPGNSSEPRGRSRSPCNPSLAGATGGC
jgi:hypothetical protein